MPIDEIAGGFLRVAGKFIVELFIQIFLEFLLRGPGYLITKITSRTDPDIEDWRVTAYGLLFWAVIVGIIYYLNHYLSAGANNA